MDNISRIEPDSENNKWKIYFEKGEKNMGTGGKLFEDRVNHPAHYAGSGIEVIDYIEDKDLGFCLGNAVKYISRAGKKIDFEDQNPTQKAVEDLNKAIWYINRRIKELEDGLCR
jgi:hypothetical protein